MKTFLVLVGFLLSLSSIAQKGSYYLADKDLSEIGLSNYNLDIAQDSRGLIYMANLQGVLVTDGRDWNLIETPYSVFALDVDENNKVYVGGRKEIAKVNPALSAQNAYQVLAKVAQEVFKIKYFKNEVYFVTDNTLYIYDLSSENLTKIDKPTGDEILDIQDYAGALYLMSAEKGVQAVSGKKIGEATLKLPAAAIGFKVSDKGEMVSYTSEGKYFFQENKQSGFRELHIEDDGFLEQNTPVELEWVNDSLIAISTISGGVVFVNPFSGKVEQYMNYENGLPDNEVLSLYSSKSHVVWCATPQGISIIAPEIPFRNYASYSGLSGNIQVVYEYKNRLFVGTSVGLYELVKKTDYEEIVSYKKITVSAPKEEPKAEKKQGLFNKKQKKKTQLSKPKTYYAKQIEKKISSVEYVYEKIEGIDAKVVQLLNYQGKLLIGSLAGIYELEDKSVSRIFDQPMVYMYKPSGYSFLMVSTYDKKVEVLVKQKEGWKRTGLLDGLNDFVEQIVQGNEKSLWLCGADSVYRIVLNNASSLSDVEVYAVNNPHWERIYSNPFMGKTYFLNTSGYYYYDNLSIKRDTLLEGEIGLPRKMLISSEGNLWVNTGHYWYGKGKSLKTSLNFISLFEDPRYLSEVGEGNYWVVAGNNQLYKIDGQKINSISRPFTLFLERAQLDSIALPITRKLGKFDQQSSLSFKFAAPDYTNIYQTEFQYRLVGLSDEWSEWSRTNNEIVFPYLPAGKYVLEVNARDALGNIKSSEAISFSILAPYWKRPWFYLFEVVFFGGLMALSVWINRNSHKFTLLSRLLTFLTLILVVEFVQTVAEAKFETNQSPVINFFIQVVIALSILPIESVLRRFITSQQAKRLEKEKTEKSEHDTGK